MTIKLSLYARYWSWDVTNAMQGRCYTIQYDQELQIEMEKDSLIIDLNENLRFSIFLHQPGFFLLTYNSLTMPTFDMVLDHNEIGDSYLTLMLEVVKHEKLSRPGSLCEQKSDYIFTDCVKRAVTREAGCKLPWDDRTAGAKYLLKTFIEFL